METSPLVKSAAGDISSSSITGTVSMITGSVGPTSGTLLWPLAVHKSVQPASQNELAKATGLTKPQLESNTIAKTTRTEHIPITTQCLAFTIGAYAGLGKQKFVAVNRSPSISQVSAINASVQCVVSQAAGKPVPMPRCLILRPVYTAATATSLGPGTVTVCRPNTPAAPCVNKSSAENGQHVQIPAVHSNVRHILMPRVIPRATFRVMAPTTASACRVVKAKTVAVPAPKQPPLSPSSSTQGLAVTRSAAPSQPAVTEDLGKVSPLSCIQTLVANAGTAMQWIAMNDDGIPEYDSSCQSESVAADENDTVIRLSVSADKRDSSSGFAGMATDDVDFKQPSCFIRKRPSATEDLQDKVAKLS